MPARFLALAAAVCLVSAGALRADLKQAMAEANLEKRSALALANAQAALKAARECYQKGDNAGTAAAAAEVRESVDLAYASLKQTGKKPRKSPKWFKHAEIETRDLLRRLDAFQDEMSYNDRPLLDKVKANVQQVHDELLLGLMGDRRQ